MPIVINEIEISIEVIPNNAPNNASQSDGALKDEIIKECVEKVMEILNLKNER